MDLKNKKIVVVGLGRSGMAVAQFLATRDALVTVVDNNKTIKKTNAVKKLMELGIDFKIGDHMPKDFTRAQLVILSPGVPHTIPAIQAASNRGISIIGEIEFASNFINKPLIGVTGTNGKTTTVKLIEKMLLNSSKKVFLGGNTGLPLTKCLNLLEDIEIIIAEISSFQLDTIKKFRPTTAVLLNIDNDHLDRYLNFNDYANSKLQIFSNQTKTNVAIFNAIDKTTKKLVYSQYFEGQKKPFSNVPIENGAQILDDSIIIFKQKKPLYQFNLRKSKLKGAHNRENIAAACIAALSEGASFMGIQSAINHSEEITHRMETVRYFHGIKFINDSKATNIHATISAINSINTPILLILGGRSKNIDFKLLNPHLSKHIKKIIAFGEARAIIKSAILLIMNKDNIITTETIEKAVKKAISFAQTGDTVLLSPSCASFDQFQSYEDRGQRFKELVKNLK